MKRGDTARVSKGLGKEASGISDGRDGRIWKRLSVRGKRAGDVNGAQTNSDAEVGKCKRKADGTETDRQTGRVGVLLDEDEKNKTLSGSDTFNKTGEDGGERGERQAETEVKTRQKSDFMVFVTKIKKDP